MAEKIILHGMGSPNVIKAIIMLEECGLDYELNHVAVFNQEQFDPAFLKLNPLGKVPVLEDPALGIPLAESGAILLWLAEREGKFLPAAQPHRADVMQWLMIQMANVGPMMGQFTHFNLVPPGSQPYAHARYGAIAEKLNRVLDDRLRGREWVAGVDYSIADMATQPWAYYLERHGFDPAAHPALVAWRERIAARPAVQRALARANAAFSQVAEQTRKAASDEDLDRFFGRTEKVPVADYSIVRTMT
ncbi:glutathione S-transferase family protein [Novosphingobium album (ex Liu et al. 2023)]|uniref:Glutathione S-transferase N-terminal domain-containing protein n=1 Tax=Novosphingobium album (ex Liu et al. 2023) TaxID=3031130 RepID=A0ABT5WXE6_9SPHN|nr:glutathione S-transferase N-terminal domain-containing protein [Novosphingobium album (ex Liu et al. 2023)]MDE8654575.1 glutathione S-transferase N-terminal domain-containing protein [Novosphingobium album (ex Liu et al. 2023)]